MKLILCLFILLITTKECDRNKAELASNNTEVTSRMIQDSTQLTYEATTRGFYLKMWVLGDSISITQDRYLKDVSTYALSETDKTAIYEMLSSIDETSLEELKPPSTTFQYDAAAMATLTIKKLKESHVTPTFDHGKPPKAIADIVNKMLSIKSEMEKQ